MVMVDNLFFELIQVALGHRNVLSRNPSEEEWDELFEMAQKQAVAGIVLVALDKLSMQEQEAMQMLLFEWIGVGEQVRAENKRLNKCCKKLQKKFTEAGVQTSILKGQGIACYYDEGLKELRQAGDIDFYVDCGRERALLVVKGEGIKVNEWDYKHAQLDIWEDVAVEMHYRVEVLLNLWKNRKLQKWFKAHTEDIFCHTDNSEMLTTPSVEFNVFYILLHIYRHFLYEGVGLRQIVDYYFVLKNLNVALCDDSPRDALDTVREFGMERFAKGLMWVMHETLGMPREWMLWEPDQKEGEYILNQVMTGGYMGHYDERLSHGEGKLDAIKDILTHNLHLLTHYPSDTIWAPVWILWHKLWKIKTKMTLMYS